MVYLFTYTIYMNVQEISLKCLKGALLAIKCLLLFFYDIDKEVIFLGAAAPSLHLTKLGDNL